MRNDLAVIRNRTQKKAKIDQDPYKFSPKSTPSPPEITQKQPGTTLGGAKLKKLKNCVFEQNWVPKCDTFWT